MAQQKVTKAVLAAAGLGTRFLPQTKAMPKEMLPILDKPVIQLIVEDLVASGIEDIIIVTGAQKRPLEDHFDRSVELEQALIKKGKEDLAEEIRNIAEMANFVYVRQKGLPLGNARPLMNASHLLKDEPFIYLWADDYFRGSPPAYRQMIDAYDRTGKAVLSLIETDDEGTEAYGIVRPGKDHGDGIIDVEEIIEKPGPEAAASRWASVHSYLLTPEILPIVAETQPSARGEVELQGSLDKLAEDGLLAGKVINGKYQDAGNKAKYIEAVIDAALDDEAISDQIRSYLNERLK